MNQLKMRAFLPITIHPLPIYSKAMPKRACIRIFSLLFMAAVPLFAQTSQIVSADVLAGSGFSFADQSRPMCKIGGPEGPCRIEAFVAGETRQNDEARFTCKKLDRATYVGHCSKGKLEGLSLVIADGSKKLAREAFISYMHEGRIAYPALTSVLVGDNNFGVEEKGKSYGCVYFGKWDESSERCKLFIQIYGNDLFTNSNAQALRDGTFDLKKYQAKFLEFMQQQH
jgi:hypothetical protein